jgi:hypothetical protein
MWLSDCFTYIPHTIGSERNGHCATCIGHSVYQPRIGGAGILTKRGINKGVTPQATIYCAEILVDRGAARATADDVAMTSAIGIIGRIDTLADTVAIGQCGRKSSAGGTYQSIVIIPVVLADAIRAARIISENIIAIGPADCKGNGALGECI